MTEQQERKKMTEKRPIKLEYGKGYRCQAPGCNKRGEIVTLDVMDGSAAEFECRLCEEHYAEARSVGQ